MKQITNELAAHIAQDTTTIATCWKITRADNVVTGFTDHIEDIIYDSVTYQASNSFVVDEIEQSAEISEDNIQMEGLLDAAAITDTDILAGVYDFAQVEVFQINYEDLTQGKLILRSGWFGEIDVQDNGYSVQMYGLTQRLEKTIGQLYSASCRAKLGDSKCQVNLAALTVTGSVTSIADRRKFTDTSRTEANGFFNYGKITFTSGANNGRSMEVKDFRDDVLELVLPMPYDVAISDTYWLEPGCDKAFSTCKNLYNNVINFRGEPHVPGIDELLKTSGTL